MFQSKSHFFLYFSLAAALFLSSCSDHSQRIPQVETNIDTRIRQDPYLKRLAQQTADNEILVLVPISGLNAQLGRGILNSCLLAAKECGDTNIKFVVIDTADRSLDMNKLLWRYKTEKLRAIIGPIFFAEARRYGAMFPNIPMFTFSNNTSVNNNHIFTCGLSPQDETDAMFRYASRCGIRSFLLMLPRGKYADEIMRCLKKSMRKFHYADGDDVEVIRYNRMSKNDATKYAANSRKRMIFVLEPIIDIERLPRKIRVFALSSHALQDKETWKGYIFAFSNMQELAIFSDKYKKIYGNTPTTLDMVGYDITSVLCKAAAIDNSENVSFILEKKLLHGCLGDFQIKRNKGIQRKMRMYTSEGD